MAEPTEGTRETPAQVNQRRNDARLAMIERVGRTADGQRADQLQDTDGQRVTGRFQDGEFDDSPEARERQAQRNDDLAEQARQEQEDRAAEAERLEQEEARRLQAEGAEGGEGGELEGTQRRQQQRSEGEREELNEAGDEKVIGGTKYYLTIVDGNEKWLTLRELREHAAVVINTEETLQRAQEALQRSTQTDGTPKDRPAEVDDKDLENIILSAAVGDEEAVRKLVSVIKARPAGVNPQDISRQVTQQIATQRAVDDAKAEQKDLLNHDVLAPIFDQRLVAFAKQKPKTSIREAYAAVGEQMRKDFAPLLQTGGRAPPADKTARKRTIVNPPEGVARQRSTEGDDREPSVSQDIDAIAKSRGQARAHRERRGS
jgi:hypothetical protein